MCWIVVARLRMAAETEANGVLKRIRTAVCLLNDVMNVGGAASKLMADTAVPSGPYKCLDADGVGERHMGGPLCGLTSRFSGGAKRRPLKPDVRRNALRSAAADLAPHPPLPEPILMPRPPQI